MPDIKSISLKRHLFPRKNGNILGVGITGTSRNILLKNISEYLRKKRRFKAKIASERALFITTPNPEQVVIANDDSKYKEILNSSDVALCDGVGLLAAYEYKQKITGKKTGNYFIKTIMFIQSIIAVAKKGRSGDSVLKLIKGRKVFLDLLELANSKRYKVFLLGSTNKILKKAVTKLSKMYPSVHFKMYKGASFDSNSVPLTDKEIKSDKISLRRINRFIPDMLFVAFGAPKQEMWVYRNIENLKTGMVMVVGGSFDYIAGTRKNVPQFIERWGLEWLWRLLSGSQNLKRIYNAIVKFPLMVIKDGQGQNI